MINKLGSMAYVKSKRFFYKEHVLILTHYTDSIKKGPQRKGKLQKSLKLPFIFLEALRFRSSLPPKLLPNHRRTPDQTPQDGGRIEEAYF
jgi:hypothetical protein